MREVCLAVLLFALFLGIQGGGDSLPTVPGPEEPALLKELHGTVLVERLRSFRDSIDLYALPTTSPHHITLEGDVVQSSGPDTKGRIAYLTERRRVPLVGGIYTELRIRSLATGEDSVVREWEGQLGNECQLGLSPATSRIAVIHPRGWAVERSKRAGTVEPWIEILETETGNTIAMRANLCDPQMRWSSDGEFLLLGPCADPHGGGKADWSGVDSSNYLFVVRMSEFELVDESRLKLRAPGFARELPANWEIRDDDPRYVRWLNGRSFLEPADELSFETESGIPGLFADMPAPILAVIDHRYPLYQGLPTEGTEQKPFFTLCKPSVEWTIKASDLQSGKFFTVIPYVRGEIRYSPVDTRPFFEKSADKK